MADEEAIREVVRLHREHYGRLDVLVNNAGVGIGANAGEHQTKYVDLQLDVNLRAIVLFYRECLDMLRAAGQEHKNALVVNLASIAGKSPSAWLSVYSATKAAVLAYTQAMNKELNGEGIKSTAFAPGLRGHRHDRLRQAERPGRGDAQDHRYRRGAPLPAPALAGGGDPGGHLPAPRGDGLAVIYSGWEADRWPMG